MYLLSQLLKILRNYIYVNIYLKVKIRTGLKRRLFYKAESVLSPSAIELLIINCQTCSKYFFSFNCLT